MEELHECTTFDQLNTCVECGAEKNPMPDPRHAEFEDYKMRMRKLAGGR